MTGLDYFYMPTIILTAVVCIINMVRTDNLEDDISKRNARAKASAERQILNINPKKGFVGVELTQKGNLYTIRLYEYTSGAHMMCGARNIHMEMEDINEDQLIDIVGNLEEYKTPPNLKSIINAQVYGKALES